jgi:hypothetical protein
MNPMHSFQRKITVIFQQGRDSFSVTVTPAGFAGTRESGLDQPIKAHESGGKP